MVKEKCHIHREQKTHQLAEEKSNSKNIQSSSHTKNYINIRHTSILHYLKRKKKRKKKKKEKENPYYI